MIKTNIPLFILNPKSISIIKTPSCFYNKLLSLISNAKKRISITSLYLGTGQLEQKLIKELSNTIKSNRKIKLKIIMDKNRCERRENGISIIDLLYPFKRNLYLYNHPNSSSYYIQKYYPSIIKELLGIFHTKIIIIDDNIILTGANLSQTYFTNRKDRYYYINQYPPLANYLDQYIHNLSTIKYHPNISNYIDNHLNVLNKYISHHNKINELYQLVPIGKVGIYPTVRY